MSPEERAAQNRLNAQKSTGPRTPEGKARSRRNALTHGLLAKTVILDGKEHDEDPAEFDALLYSLISELCPVGALEDMCVEKIAVCYWRLQRAVKAEALAIHERYAQQQGPEDERKEFWEFIEGIRRRKQAEKDRAAAIERGETPPEPAPVPQPARQPERAVYALPTADRFLPLLRYETTIDRQLQRAIDRFETLKARRYRQVDQLAKARAQAMEEERRALRTQEPPLTAEEKARYDDRPAVTTPGFSDRTPSPVSTTPAHPDVPASSCRAEDTEASQGDDNCTSPSGWGERQTRANEGRSGDLRNSERSNCTPSNGRGESDSQGSEKKCSERSNCTAPNGWGNEDTKPTAQPDRATPEGENPR